MSPGRIALGYAVIAILWIAFSDAVVTHLRLQPVVMTMKGTVFVIVTALLLYFTIRRLVQAAQLTAQELRQQERALRQVLDFMPDLVAEFDSDRKRLYANRPTLDYFGVTLEEWWSTSDPYGFYHPDDWERVMQSAFAQSESAFPREYEARMRRADGEYRWFFIRENPLRDEEGRITRWYVSGTDIEDRKQAEQALRQSEEYLAEAQRLTRTGSFAWDSAGEKYSYWSEEMFQIFGFDKQKGLPAKEEVLRLFLPEDLNRVEASIQRAIRERTDTFDEYTLVLPDQTIKHIQVIRHPVLDQAGGVVKLVGTIVDTTERKRAEEALRESETRFRTLVDHAGDAIFVEDLDQGTIVDVNRQACESLGYTRQELIGTSPLAFHLDSDRAGVKSSAERAVAGETAFDRHSHRRMDGSLFPVEVHTSLVPYEGRRFLLKIARDITDRVRAEEQRDRLRQLEAELAHIDRVNILGELAASISHELNQPIAASMMNASLTLQMLEHDPPDLAQARQLTARVIEVGTLASEIIDRLRSLYKKELPKREPLTINEAIGEMVVLLRPEATRHAVSVRADIADSLPIVLADRVQIQQVLMNLMLNGIEVMSETGGVLTVRSQLKENSQIEISVNDTGPGLPPGKAGQIFDAFFTTKPQGSGMGLAISKSIVESHGGRIWADDNGGRGATFHFTLPAAPSEASLPEDGACGFTGHPTGTPGSGPLSISASSAKSLTEN